MLSLFASPPEVGTSIGPVLSAGFTSVMTAITDLGPWVISIGLAVLVIARSIESMRRGHGPNPFGQNKTYTNAALERQARSRSFQRKIDKGGMRRYGR